MSGKSDYRGGGTGLEASHLRCVHCKELLTDPILLPCLHSICLGCLSMLIGANPSHDRITCPECQEDLDIPEDGTKAFPKNYYTQGLVSVHRAKTAKDNRCKICELQNRDKFARFACLNCGDFLCDDCSRAHCQTRMTIEHHVTPLSELANGTRDKDIREMQIILCPEHEGEGIKYYCETCHVPICRECQLEIHVGHKCAPVAKSQKSRRAALSNMVDNVNHKLKGVKRIEENVDVALRDIDKREQDLIDGVEKTAKKLIAQIEREKSEMLGNLKRTMNSQRQSCSERKDQLNQVYSVMEGNVNFCEDIIKNGKDEEILFLETAIRKRLKAITTKDVGSPTMQWLPPDIKFRNLFINVDRIGLFELNVAREFARGQDKPIHFGARHVAGLRLVRRISITAREDPFECRATGLAILHEDHLVVGDQENRKVKIFTKIGGFVESVATVKATGLAVCGDIIGCTDSMSLNLYTNDKTVKKKVSLESTGSSYPMTAMSGQHLVVANNVTASFLLFDLRGELVADIVPHKGSNVKNPVFIAANSKGQLIVSDWMANAVIMLDRTGAVVTEYRQKGKAGRGWLPGSICVDKFDNIFVSDFSRSRIMVLDPTGNFMLEYVTRMDHLDRPRCMTCDGQGYLYVSGKGGYVNIYACEYA